MNKKKKRPNRADLIQRARRLASFGTGIASAWCFISLLNLYSTQSLSGAAMPPLVNIAWVMLAVNVIALIGSWRGRYAPQWGAMAALFGGVSMSFLIPTLVFNLITQSTLWLMGVLVFGAYALPYFIVAGLQWRVYRLMRHTKHSEAAAYSERLALAEAETGSFNAQHEPPEATARRRICQDVHTC